jgi:hypothetical protein
VKHGQFDSGERDGTRYWLVSEQRLETLKHAARWEAHRLDIPRVNTRIVKAGQMFETASMRSRPASGGQFWLAASRHTITFRTEHRRRTKLP